MSVSGTPPPQDAPHQSKIKEMSEYNAFGGFLKCLLVVLILSLFGVWKLVEIVVWGLVLLFEKISLL